MKRKIACRDLEAGMYVVELDRPWGDAPFEPPFEIQGFTTQARDVKKVQDLCRYVYIDPTLGKGAKRYLAETQQVKAFSDAFSSFTAAANAPTPAIAYKDQTTLREELPVARRILSDTNDVYFKVINDLTRDRQTNADDVKNVVTGLVESVVRNPDVLTWLVGLKQKDSDTYVHAISVAVMALAVGRYLGFPKERLEVLGAASLLQDIGKIALSEDLLSKREDLNMEERNTIRDHVTESVNLLENSRGFNIEIIHTVRMHHERFDGSGYPQGLYKNEIPQLSVISGITDCYQAGRSRRPYRDAKTSFQVLMELYRQRDTLFPGGVIEQFIQCVGIFPVGSFVKLNTGEIGVVVRRNQIQQLKPKVMTLIDSSGLRLENPETIDLTAQYLEPHQTPRMIAGVVDPAVYNLNPNDFFV